MTTQVPVGDLYCQNNTFARELITDCISCSDKPDKKGFYHVYLKDTILFPEGGGQPSDTGYIGKVKVHQVLRHQLAHVHYTQEPVSVGQVKLELDWARRWDHVQQHSGQHLLSAVLEQAPYRIETVSWNLGEKRSYIEIPQTSVTPELLQQLESDVNDRILQNLPVRLEQTTERPSTLPEDYIGAGGVIRTIVIEGLDRNPCCGTHVSRLGQLQSCKLLHTESAKGGHVRLFFLFGQRVLDGFGSIYGISRQLTALISSQPEGFLDQVGRLQVQVKEGQKKARRLLDQLAALTVDQVVADRAVLVLHKVDADLEFLGLVANGIRDRGLLPEGAVQKRVVVLAAGPVETGGPVIVVGTDNDCVQKAGRFMMKTLSGLKGGGKGRWQGKAQTWAGIENLETLLDQELQI